MRTLPGQVLLWIWFAALVIHCVTSTGKEWKDAGEEEDFEKDLQIDSLSIADRSQFMKQYGQLRKEEISSQIEDQKDNFVEDDMLMNEMTSFHYRYKRHALENATYYAYSGDDDPCNTTTPVCNTSQDCVHDHDNPNGYLCQCKVEYDPDPIKVCVPIPDSRRLYLTTTLDINFVSDFNDPHSLTYQTLKQECEQAFADVLMDGLVYKTLKVSSFRNGSTVVVYSMMFNVNVTDDIILKVGQNVLKMEERGYINFTTKVVSIKGYTGIFRTLNATSSNTGEMDWCRNSSLYVCNNRRVCVNTGLRYWCDCQKGYVDVNGECIVETEVQYDMYAYGANVNHQIMAKGDDEVQRVDISAGLPVANTLQYTAYVGINGLITFGARDSGLNFQIDKNKMMLCPFMADIITLGSDGNVWYHVYTQRSQNTTVFDKASSEVKEFLQLDGNYKTTLVMVITWDKVSHYSSTRRDTEQATFQTVLVSDGTTAYALVYYKTNGMKWVYKSGTQLVIGQSDGEGNEAKVNVYSNTAAAFTNLGTIKGNTGRRGMWIYKVGEKYSADQECDVWYMNQTNYGTLNWMNSILPQCPCSSASLGFGWIQYRSQNGALCYRLSASRSWRFYPYGRECCYRSRRGFLAMTLVLDLPNAGGVTAYNPSFPELLDLNMRFDRNPHDTCCYKTTSRDYCRKYYVMRPIGLCSNQFQYQSSWFMGDPHIITLDGKEYTFNGWGEYTMVKINNSNVTFTLQGRTGKVLTENGTETDATVFTAFAARESSTNVFVQLDPNDNKSLIVYALDKDYSIQFRENPDFMMESRECTLTRSNTSLSVSFPSEIEIIITPGIKLLDITVNMPNKFKNQTAGLMGNFNGNPSDDFILPNGILLSKNLTERQIFETFGSLWAVSDNESVFRYEERQGPANFRHYNFTPIFLDEMSDDALNESIKVCGSKNNTACVYDFMATGSKAIAEATQMSKASADEADLTIKNSIPELNVTSTINVDANTSYTFTLKGSDADAKDVLTYHVADNVIGNVALNSSTGEVTYMPNSSQPANLSFYVLDDQSASSPVRIVVVLFCTGCSGRGMCDYTTARPNSDSQSFQLAVCNCTTGWTGDDCDKDFDGCSETPCISGQNCTDVTPDQHVALGRGYNCSSCPLGYAVNNVTNKCEDVNECYTTTHGCSQECNNTAGSYFCTCRKGYRLNTNGRSCDDINECAEKTDTCSQICNNIDGSYNCSCEPGYKIDVNGTCIQELTAQQICDKANCSQGCKVENQTAECFCMPGYTINTTNKTRCDDINECSKKICSQGCNNSVGSFTCSCYAGFQLEADGTTCSPCPSLQYGPGCLNTCECNGRGTACNPVTGCVCQSGWRGTNCQEDVNECVEIPNICGSTLQICVNTNGSYRCDCLRGYTKNSAGSCTDVNECESGSGLNTCGSLEVCTNTVGSFYCSCRTGYYRNATVCTDVDECLSGVATCQQVCVNTLGSYNCKCKYGFRLNADRVTCSQEQDVCLGEENLKCAHGCTLNSNDRAVCFCRTGYKLGTDLQACIDIDECNTGTSNCSHTCTNLPGSFVCTCPVGYYLQTDQKTCTVCETGTFGENCTSQCSCGVGALNCDHVTGCVCKFGWMGLTCDQDINECATEIVAAECLNKSAICDNDPGSYKCSCRPGYRKDITGVCQDIDECDDSPCNQICENNVGSYHCLCNVGFNLNLETNKCEDYNECLLSVDNQCTQECINTDGGYRCSCNQFGYVLANDGYSCTARHRCTRTNCSVINGGCSVLNGTDTCFCNTGYNWNGTECILPVVDWCSRANCSQTCYNQTQHPYYKCDCNSGFQLNPDGKTCRRCAAWTYGNCSTSCACNPKHSINCSNINGTCLCADGWTGPTCDLDIDECNVIGTYNCPANSSCVNTFGSYICVCATGYLQTASGNCSACSGSTYGDSCAFKCNCSAVNTASCDNVNGKCYCKTGWTGQNCTEDINECTQNSHNCSGQNTNCSNTDGGYECVCNKGYALNDSGICVDLNECLDYDANDCVQNCTNTLGGYTCSCWYGYNGTGNNCTACHNYTYGDNCTQTCNCSSVNTVSCDNVNGTCHCRPGWTGTSCDLDIDECTTVAHNCTGNFENCSNTDGGFQCVCQAGYHYNSSNTCVICSNYTYGDNCTETCNCSSANTFSCDHVNGTCYCRPGWTGISCDLDIDECTTVTQNCTGSFENCSNTNGSFHCVCQPGYHYNSSNACVACNNNTYGDNCTHTCNCSSVNTLSCDNVNGTCYCWPGWTGTSCDLDKDECTTMTHNCTGNYENCRNTDGGFTCVCQPGYYYNSTNACDDNKEAQYELYPYGVTVNDKQLRGDDDTVSLELSTGFPVADTLQYTVHVGINGLITFGSRNSGLGFKIDGSKPMLSPYLTDINTVGNEGRVWYNIYEQSKANGSIFPKVNFEIKEFMQLSSYSASLLVIVTWDKVSHYNSLYPQREQATFQTVLVSDGTTSYALVYYKTGSMNWVYRQGTPIVIGQSSGKNESKLSIYSNTPEAFTSMGHIKGNTGRIGTWIYKMGEKYSADQKCNDWYYNNLQRKAQIDLILLSMTQCPCSSFGLRSAWIPYRVQNDVTCYRLNKGESRLFYPYGKDCCYRFVSGNLLLVSDMPDAGGITSNNPSYRELRAMNILQDKEPHDTCCYKSTSMDYCKKYYELRPIGQCSSSFGFASSSVFGDPHIITLDGKEYIFNGWGEYTMVKIDNDNVTFTLQGRTGRVVSDNDTETNATVFTAFAAQENRSRVFVQLNPNDNKTLIVFAGSEENGLELQDLTTAFQNTDFHLETDQYTLRKDNSSLSIAFTSGIELIITPGTNQTRVLELSVNLPQIFNGTTRGLMGNFNGRPEDDFILIDGIELPANMTEREIFTEFGSKWAVRDNDSVFHYEGQLGPADFRHPTFEPVFLDEMSVNATQTAKDVCGENNTACIYDYLVTGSQDFANSTLQAKTLADQTAVTIKNKVPTLNVNETIVVKVNTTMNFTLDGNDEDEDTLTYHMVGDGQENVILNNTTGDVIYTANLNYDSSLSFYVVDIKNAASPVREIIAVICTDCSQHGECDLTRVRPNPNSLAFSLAVCNCTRGWTGDECEHDFDACAENPCIVGQNCTDRKPGDNETHTCSGCPTGYDTNTNNSKCDDIDECNTASHGCSHMCNNTLGSYQCSCRYGYRLNTDGRTCDDINECADKTAKCQHICTNTDGHYNCSCESGYKLESNNSCTEENNTDCTSVNCNQGCKVVNTTQECFCFAGYTLSPNTSNCIDANECTMGICSQVCNNTVGSFTCSCYSGYKLDIDGTTCVPCPSLQYGPDCQNTCECSGRGTGCNPVTGCVCQDGWKGEHCEVDKDECQEDPSTCGTALQECVNTNGSYRCECLAGYTKNSNEECQDVDECADSFGLKCGNLEDCHNTPGSFYCTCKTGYVKNKMNCTDIDECNSGLPVCEHMCKNTQGSYNCECRQGFQLDTDRVSCRKITDVCPPTENCTQGCDLQNNQSVCFCKTGFILKDDNKTCIDIDECNITKSLCSHYCTNLNGSFTCSCPDGYYLTADRKNCTECEPGTYGVNCSSLCSCGIGASGCNKTTGCVCRSGWTGVNCDQDVNGCVNDSKKMECRNMNATCQNIPGGYRCQCQVGYQNISDLCQDINECDSSPCSQACENTVGSYRCLCNAGFTWNASTSECQDNDECRLSVDNRCKQICINTIGSYRCGCNQSGFELANDGYTCTAKSICTNLTCNTTFGGCSNINGTETCFCNNGYELVNSTECVLKQVNWCQLASCEQNCSNSTDPPYYQCSCLLGHVLNTDGKTCRPCAHWTYGNYCSLNCSCNTLNSYNCSNTDGTCTCMEGWGDKNCSGTSQSTSNTTTSSVTPTAQSTPGTSSTGTSSTNTTTSSSISSSVLPSGTSVIPFGLTIDINITVDISNKSSSNYTSLRDEVSGVLFAKLNGTITALFKVEVTDMRSGSLVIDAKAISNATEESVAPSLAIAVVGLKSETFNINNQMGKATDVRVRNQTVNNVCDAFLIADSNCPGECDLTSERPSCKQAEKTDIALIIGLAVGIPLFFSFLAVIVVVVYIRIKRKRQKSELGSDDGRSTLSAVFSRSIPTRNPFWSPWKGAYTPDSRSTASSEEYDRHRKRSDFERSPWDDSFGGFGKKDAAKSSNFSWDFLYNQLDTDQPFTIKRPVISLSQIPAYKGNQSSDSQSWE